MAERAHTHRWLAVIAGTLGTLALAAREPYPAGRAPEVGDSSVVTAVDVARWIRNRHAGLRLVDVRADTLFATYHLPGAERMTLGDLSREIGQRNLTIVVYADDDATATRAATALRPIGATHVYALRGGLSSWIGAIMQPHLTPLPASATPAERSARREQLELSRYFGGTPIVSPSVSPGAASRPHGEAAAVARVIRRGC